MAQFSPKKIIDILTNINIDKNDIAENNTDLIEELDNVLEETRNIIKNRKIWECCKYVLWHGINNQYGTMGYKQHKSRSAFYSRNYKYGDLVSVDFGTHNISNEFSFTHTGIVLANYSDLVTVVPLTSQKDIDPVWITEDPSKIFIPVTTVECDIIKDDSYILIFQIKTVSKNRIQKYIGNIADNNILIQVKEKIISSMLLTTSEKHDKL